MAGVHTIGSSLRSAAKYLALAGVADPGTDAEILLAHAMGDSRASLIARSGDPLPDPARLKFNRFISRRGEGREPVAYLTGIAGFYGLEFKVAPTVLIPRPSTETLVERAIGILPGKGRFADIGTGSGAIAVAILANRGDVGGVGTDVSTRALSIAGTNKALLDDPGRLELRHGGLFAPLGRERFALIVSNPPYIADPEFSSLAPELGHEPREALSGGGDGLEIIRRLVAGLSLHLEPGARALVEVGAGQAGRVRELALHAGFHGVQFHKDLEGVDRVVEAW